MGIWWTTKTVHGETLLFRNGDLVYKRWPTGLSVLIDAVPRFAYWHRSLPQEPEKEQALLSVAPAVAFGDDVVPSGSRRRSDERHLVPLRSVPIGACGPESTQAGDDARERRARFC
jgi:hypothetical protein